MIDYALSKCRELPYVRGQYRHYALVLDKRNRVVSESANSYIQTHPRAFKAASKVGRPLAVYLHAEQRALYLDKKRKGVKLIVVRVGAIGQAMCSEPCEICREVLKDFPNIKTIEFSV
jgi:hypothetical protein